MRVFLLILILTIPAAAAPKRSPSPPQPGSIKGVVKFEGKRIPAKPIVMAADAVSSARPGARRDSMERYIQRLNDLQDVATSFSGVTEAYAIQAGREVRVMVDAARVGDDEAFQIAAKIAKKISEEMTFPGEIRVTVLRETRAIEIAR